MNEYLDPGALQPLTSNQSIPADTYAFLWPEINPTIAWVALIIGLLLLIVGYFAGGRLNVSKIIICVIFTSVLGFLGRSVLNPVMIFMVASLNLDVRTAFVLTSSIWMFFISAVSILLYETLIVTAKEAYSH